MVSGSRGSIGHRVPHNIAAPRCPRPRDYLSAILFPPGLRRLYCLRDNDSAGDFAEERLGERAREAGIGFRVLIPAAKDLNVDLREGPFQAMKQRMAAQLEPEDRFRFAG